MKTSTNTSETKSTQQSFLVSVMNAINGCEPFPSADEEDMVYGRESPAPNVTAAHGKSPGNRATPGANSAPFRPVSGPLPSTDTGADASQGSVFRHVQQQPEGRPSLSAFGHFGEGRPSLSALGRMSLPLVGRTSLSAVTRESLPPGWRPAGGPFASFPGAQAGEESLCDEIGKLNEIVQELVTAFWCMKNDVEDWVLRLSAQV